MSSNTGKLGGVGRGSIGIIESERSGKPTGPVRLVLLFCGGMRVGKEKEELVGEVRME